MYFQKIHLYVHSMRIIQTQIQTYYNIPRLFYTAMADCTMMVVSNKATFHLSICIDSVNI
jgi:hypothetical protein